MVVKAVIGIIVIDQEVILTAPSQILQEEDRATGTTGPRSHLEEEG